VEGQWFSPGPPASSTNKSDRHDVTELLLKVTLSTIKPTNQYEFKVFMPNVQHILSGFIKGRTINPN
jgi:hypothetical protein